MAIKNNRDIKHYLVSNFFCIPIYIIFIVIVFINKYPVEEFLYCLPIIAFLLTMEYFIFWRPDNELSIPYIVTNLITLIVMTGIFFGIYFGLYSNTLAFKLEKVSDCKVVGIQTKSYGIIDKYAILYVDYKLNDQNMLGYACLSTGHSQVAGMDILNPYSFYTKDSYFPCGEQPQSIDFFQAQKQVTPKYTDEKDTNRRINDNNPINLPNTNFRYCTAKYQFSEVKIASWMCLPWETKYEELIASRSCYMNFFSLDNEEDINPYSAYSNSLNREEIKLSKQFALISFNRLMAPFEGYLCFLFLIFCPWVISTNILFYHFSLVIFKQLNTLRVKQYFIQKQNQSKYNLKL